MKIKHKLYFLGFASILGIIILIIAKSVYIEQSKSLFTASTLVDKLEIRLLNLRRNEKDFLLREDIKYLDKFKANTDTFLKLEQQLSSILTSHGLSPSDKLRQDIIKYAKGFEKLVLAKNDLGLTPESGMRAEYNRALSQALDRANPQGKLALLEFDEALHDGEVKSALLNENSRQLVDLADAIAKQHVLIGVAYNKGLMGEARNLSHTVEEQFVSFSKLLNQEVIEEENYLSTIETSLSIAIMVIILAIILQISRNINFSVNSLLSVISNMSNTNNVGLRVELKGKDELSTVGNFFNSLLSKIEDLVVSSQSKSRELTVSTSRMHEELEGVISQFNNQAEHTDLMATSVKEMVSTIGEISQSTNVAVEGVEQAAQNAAQGRVVLETTLRNIGELSGRLRQSQQSITSLNEFVDQIGGAVTIIQGIAEQTNLLALNAAIEAARAGEQGRGFAVVADEVRSLATRTQKSTEDITKVVSSIQAQMNNVVNDIELCAKQGSDTQEHSAQLDENLQKIIDDMHEIQGNSQRIAAAIEEQGVVMNQVSDSITELNAISDKNTVSAKEVLKEVDSVATQTHDLDTSVSLFKTSKG